MIGLYYPYFHFRDESWLKLAALYWDKMARIVPYDYPTKDSDDVKRLKDAEFVRNYVPEVRDIEEVSRVFDLLVAQHEEELLSHYNVHLRDTWQDVSQYRYRSRSAVSGDPRLEYVFRTKLNWKLTSHLEEVGLAKSHPNDPDWVGMHPRLAHVYMSALAEQMAQRSPDLYPVTENALYHLAVSGLTMERLAQALLDPVHFSGPVHTDKEIETYLAMISFEYVLPKDIEQVPVEKIITLRKRLRDKHGDKLEDVYVHEIGPELRALERELRLLNIDTVTGALNLKFEVPLALTIGAAVLGMALNPIVAAAGAIAMAGLKIVGDKEKKNRLARQRSQVTWLLPIEQGLRPEGLLSKISHQVGKFHFPM